MRNRLFATLLMVGAFVLSAVIASAFVYTWNENTPSDTESYKLGSSRIRELKHAIRERIAVDHVLTDFASGETMGYHKKVTLLVQSTDPDSGLERGIVYTKDVTGDVGLYYRGVHSQPIRLDSKNASVEIAIGTSDITNTETRYYSDMDDMVITDTFLAGVIKTTFSATIATSSPIGTSSYTYLCETIDDDTVITHLVGINAYHATIVPVSFSYATYVAAGSHTIKIRWKPQDASSQQLGASLKRILMVEK
jgi:hypothetical protein